MANTTLSSLREMTALLSLPLFLNYSNSLIIQICWSWYPEAFARMQDFRILLATFQKSFGWSWV